MKKILVLFLSLLALVFVACGKDKNLESYLDMENILNLKIKMIIEIYSESLCMKRYQV